MRNLSLFPANKIKQENLKSTGDMRAECVWLVNSQRAVLCGPLKFHRIDSGRALSIVRNFNGRSIQKKIKL